MNTPQLIEHRDMNVRTIKQSSENFLIVDSLGIIIYTYEGRVLSQSKFAFSLGALQMGQITMNALHWLIVDPRDQRHVIGHEAVSGRSLASSSKTDALLTHKDQIKQITAQAGSKVYAFVDQQREVYLVEIVAAKT